MKKTMKCVFALMLALILALSPLSPMMNQARAEDGSGKVLDASTLAAFAAGAKADGESQKAGDFFTILWSAKSKVDSSNKSWDDGYASGQRINFGGSVKTTSNAIKFETAGAATVKIWWVQGGDDNRQMAILDDDGNIVAITEGTYTKNDPYYSELTLENAGTYYLGGSGGNNYIFKVEVNVSVVNTLEASTLTAFAAGAKADGEAQKFDDFFTILWSAKSKVDSSNKTWEDDYTSGQRINFGGKATTTQNSVKFETSEQATVKIWWVEGGDDSRQMAILDADGNIAAITEGTYIKNDPYISELTLENAGTYYLGGSSGNNYIFKIEVTTGSSVKPPRGDWDGVAAPEITDVAVKGGDIIVTVSAFVGYDGADKVTVTMTNASGAEVSKSSSADNDTHTLTFTPDASGVYTFTVSAFREEDEHKGEKQASADFSLPLTKPNFKSASNIGGGAVKASWDAVKEAEHYVLAVSGTEIVKNVEGLEAEITGLTVGETYTLTLTAIRGEDSSEAGTIDVTVKKDAEIEWAFSAFGTGVTLSANGYSGNANDGSVNVWSTGGKGKLVPASTDGLAFYYTKIDPNTTNFKLSAKANVTSWTYSNGQEGFGLMAADSVGVNGDSNTFWNNSYMASVTKVEYTENGSKVTMKLGVGSQEKIGVTPDNINEALQLDDMSVYTSVMRTLETSCAAMGGGTYNLVGNFTNDPGPDGTIENPLTTFDLTIEKNNTGYFVSYTDPQGITNTNKYYDTEALNYLEGDSVYVGFFASRNATIEFTDISFTTSDPATDAPPEDRPVSYVDPSFIVESAAVANSEDYTLVYYGNADGTLTVTQSGTELYNGAVKAGVKSKIPVTLAKGKNSFELKMTPDPEYKPSEYELLSSYDAKVWTHTVSYDVNTALTVYVSPDGKADAAGTREAPTTLASAVTKAIPGQTIIMLEGTYSMPGKLVIERGMDGTAEKNINLFADENAATRPVIDFELTGAGLILAGNYWHLKGFDVTRTANGEKGITVAGKFNTLELLETYRNGNTGIQISRFKGTDEFDEWPSDNLILNCTSMLNADRGYEDADGFAAKLTIGNGNVFDGCISAYNADDGWDLYAKIENGPIGKVVIKNSVAYKNGYILDENGKEVNAGNGNGFKMGGESITGYHTLINSVAFANKAKGIDSNSCPDIQVESSTSFDNEANNVAFYTNTAVNTDFSAKGVISYKKSNTVGENIKPVGSQDTAKIYGADNYYYDGGVFKNTEGVQVEDDWFVSLDAEKAINGGITRYADGSVNMNGFLELTDKAPANAGAHLEKKAVKGDLNGDGMVTNADVIIVARALVNIVKLTDEQFAAADWNNNKKLTNADLVFLARSIVER